MTLFDRLVVALLMLTLVMLFVAVLGMLVVMVGALGEMTGWWHFLS